MKFINEFILKNSIKYLKIKNEKTGLSRNEYNIRKS